MTSRITS